MSSVWCSPEPSAGPLCPTDAPADSVSFVDPSAQLVAPDQIRLGQLVYVAPFARLDAADGPIEVGSESNIEDGAVVIGNQTSAEPARAAALAVIGLDLSTGVVMAARTVLGHNVTIKGPAILGVGGGSIPANSDGKSEVILNQGAEVDGAILEQNTAVSVFARVGPGVRLRSGYMVMPGKNVTTQAEADDPMLGKVIMLTEEDVAGTELSVDANTAFARDYAQLFRDDATHVQGINHAPGGSRFSPERALPQAEVTPGGCEGGVSARDPGFLARVIGPVCFEDPLARLTTVIAPSVSLRNDEGAGVPFLLAPIGTFEEGVVFHNVEGSGITVGSNVTLRKRATLHSGPGRDVVISADVVLNADAVVFGSTVGEGAVLGEKSLVGFSDIPAGSQVPPRAIILGGQMFGTIEW
jgi:carbonic anhydrase/acetyltransferase-like protein (isoleucine patch superfamily)